MLILAQLRPQVERDVRLSAVRPSLNRIVIYRRSSRRYNGGIIKAHSSEKECVVAFAESHHLTNTQISDYVDGLLSPAEQQEVELHLHKCAICRAEVRSHRRLRRIIYHAHLRRPADTGPLHL